MSITIRTNEPTALTQGERIIWTKTFDDYSAEDYTLEYRFRSQAGPGFNVTAVANGSDFDAEITAAMTADKAAGSYSWQAWLAEIGAVTNTFIAATGEMTLKPGFSSDAKAAIDLRTPAKITLDAIDAALLAAGTSDIVEYELTTPSGSRRVKRRSDLLEMRKEFARIVANEIARERVRNGGSFGQRVEVRMYDE
jgi:hypothetical protein